MSRIFKNIPGSAADYSGVASVFHDMGGMIVFFDAGSCMGNYSVFDEPRFSTFDNIFSLNLLEKDVVMGLDKMAVNKIINAYKEVGGKAIFLVGTPVSAIVGTDYCGIASEIKKELGIPVVCVESSGMNAYDKGQEMAYLALAKYNGYLESNEIADVNIIGATPIDSWDYNQMDEFESLIRECGAKSTCIWGEENTLAMMPNLKDSRLNIVVSVSGLKVAKLLKKKYETPYLVGFPVGREAIEEWRITLNSILNNKKIEKKEKSENCGKEKFKGKRILLNGEQVTCNMIRQLLRNEFGCEEVDLVTFFEVSAEIKEENDLHVATESEYIDILKDRVPYEIIIGDSFLMRGIPYEATLIPIPNMAISGLVFNRQTPILYGEKGSLYFEQI